MADLSLYSLGRAINITRLYITMQKLAVHRAVYQIEQGGVVVEHDYQVSDSRYNFEGQRAGVRELIRCPHCIEATERRERGEYKVKTQERQGGPQVVV